MITRRSFCLTTAAALSLPGLLRAGTTLDYTPGMVDERLAAGETLLVDFFATWCSTCRVQERTLGALRSANPAYDEAMTFIKVDWDLYGRAELSQRLAIPRRSTLVLLRGEEELGRLVAETRQPQIQALLDLALT